MQQITKTLKVLLIEDSLTDAILLERVFQRMTDTKLELTRVELLRDALKCLDRHEFDVVLLDLSLPDSWGLESLQKIQTVAREIPIIVLTGTDNDEMAISALREGAQDYLIKDNSINSEIFSRLLKRAIDRAIERKRIIKQLSHREALYRGVIEDQTEFICRFLPNGKISFVNQAFSRYLAETPTELLKRDFFLPIASEDISLVTLNLSCLSQESPHTVIEFRGNRQQELCWQQWNIRAIFSEGKIVEYQGVGQDISERKQAETEKVRLIASLHESQENFRVVTNSSPVLIWMSDVKGKPIFVNQFWLEFTGKSLEQSLIEDWLLNVHLSDLKECQTIYRHALQHREYFALEYRFKNHQGKYRWILNTGVPRFDRKGQFAGFVCSGIDISQRKKAEELLAQQAKRNYILAEITKHIHESLDLNTILQTTTEEVNSFLQAEKITISKIEYSVNSTIFSDLTATKSGNSCDLSSILERNFWQVEDKMNRLKAGEIIVLENADRELENVSPSTLSDQQVLVKQKDFNGSIVVVPITIEKKLWGIFSVEQCSKPRAWKFAEIELIEQITRHLAIAIKQAELYQTVEENNKKLKELTVIDSLTGIANRRKFDEYLESEWLRLAREKGTLSLILCDLDYFKLYNDTYGHQAGDRCLQQVAQAIKKTVKRPADLTARYGGEELAVILPNTTLEGAKKVARDIRQQIQALQIPHINSSADLYVTLSLGVASCIPERDATVESLLAQADKNLYQAKKTGRNRVVGD